MRNKTTIDLVYREEAIDLINELNRHCSNRMIAFELNSRVYTFANRPFEESDINKLSAPHWVKSLDISDHIESLKDRFNKIKPQPPTRRVKSLFHLSKDEAKVIKHWAQHEFGQSVSDSSIDKLVQHHYQRELIKSVIIGSRKRTLPNYDDTPWSQIDWYKVLTLCETLEQENKELKEQVKALKQEENADAHIQR